MAVGLPVVATSLSIEGMSLNIGEDIIVADDNQTFARNIAKLYKDKSLWEKISKTSMEKANQMWGPESAWFNLSTILTDLGFGLQRNEYALKLFSHYENIRKPV